MVKRSRSTVAWSLKGIDPTGPLVGRVEEAAAKDGITVEAWVEHWLGVVLQHHYGNPAGETGQDVSRGAALQADLRRNLKTLEENMSKIYQIAERTHEAVRRAEEDVHQTEERVHSREGHAARHPERQ